jgi:hypothetical protein
MALGLLAAGTPESSGFAPRAGVAGVTFDATMAETGDLVFRRGSGVRSQAVLQGDPQSPYSHVGLVVREDAERWVIHALPGAGVVREHLDDFLAEARLAALYRVEGLSDAEREGVRVAALEMLGRPFDDALDLSNPEALYCTELVWLAFRNVGVELVDAPRPIRLPLVTRRVILPGQLLAAPGTAEVSAFLPPESVPGAMN